MTVTGLRAHTFPLSIQFSAEKKIEDEEKYTYVCAYIHVRTRMEMMDDDNIWYDMEASECKRVNDNKFCIRRLDDLCIRIRRFAYRHNIFIGCIM